MCLSLEGLMSAVGQGSRGYCSSCYTGVYPVAFPQDEKSYLQLTLKLDNESTKEAAVKEPVRKEPVPN